jgi:NDP-sugar pyrophosphorylase family protein
LFCVCATRGSSYCSDRPAARARLPLLDSDVIVIVNGDTLCETDLAPMIARHHDSGAAATLGLIRNPAPDRYNIVQLDGADRITDVVPKWPAAPKPLAKAGWHFVGIQVVNAAVFRRSRTVTG